MKTFGASVILVIYSTEEEKGKREKILLTDIHVKVHHNLIIPGAILRCSRKTKGDTEHVKGNL